MALSNLPPGVTDSDIEAQVGQDGVLSAECESFLASEELSSVAQPRNDKYADIYTCDGDPLFVVTLGIDVHDLRTLYFHSRREYDRGLRNGKQAMRDAIRNLIGAAAEPVDL